MRKHYNSFFFRTEGLLGMKENLAPEGAIVKVAGLKKFTVYWKSKMF
jgi:Dihydroxyacid dehydratase/phosphogluconate dehydratase